MKLPEGDEVFSDYLEDNDYQLKKYKTFRKKFPPERRMCAIDVGAHVGFWTKYMAEDFDWVHSFEPISENYDCLVHNKPSNCTTYNFGLGSKEEEKTLYLGSKSNSGAWSYLKGEREIEESVRLRTLDSLNLNPDLIKIDVEGSQRSVLAGAIETLKRCKPVIIIELENVNLRRKVEKLLGKLGAGFLRNYGKDCMYTWRQ